MFLVVFVLKATVLVPTVKTEVGPSVQFPPIVMEEFVVVKVPTLMEKLRLTVTVEFKAVKVPLFRIKSCLAVTVTVLSTLIVPVYPPVFEVLMVMEETRTFALMTQVPTLTPSKITVSVATGT